MRRANKEKFELGGTRAKEEVKTETNKQRKKVIKPRQKDSKHKYKEFCEQCDNKKCVSYDRLYGREFVFGDGPISDDMLDQYNNYCQIKIEKFDCDK